MNTERLLKAAERVFDGISSYSCCAITHYDLLDEDKADAKLLRGEYERMFQIGDFGTPGYTFDSMLIQRNGMDLARKRKKKYDALKHNKALSGEEEESLKEVRILALLLAKAAFDAGEEF